MKKKKKLTKAGKTLVGVHMTPELIQKSIDYAMTHLIRGGRSALIERALIEYMENHE